MQVLLIPQYVQNLFKISNFSINYDIFVSVIVQNILKATIGINSNFFYTQFFAIGLTTFGIHLLIFVKLFIYFALNSHITIVLLDQ